MNDLQNEIGDREAQPLTGLLDVVAFFIREYELRNGEMSEPEHPLAAQIHNEAAVASAQPRSAFEDAETQYPASATGRNRWLGARLALTRRGSYAHLMKRVEIDLPDETFAGLDRESTELATELRAAAAAKLYELGRVSQEVAAQIAGVSRSEFLAVLSKLKVSPMQESTEEALAGAHVLLQP
jgi:predicted HTH domain antitoxin